jgi:hypothetical protein
MQHPPTRERERERETRQDPATLIVSYKHHIGGVVEEEY